MAKLLPALVLALSLPALSAPAAGGDYPVVYVRSPRLGDGSKPGDRIVNIPEAANPMLFAPGSDLVLRHPDGKEEVLVEAGHGAVCDPYVSFDGRAVYYAHCPDARGKPWMTGRADVWKIDLATRRKTRLTHQERTAASGWRRRWKAEEGVFNLGPCPLPGGRIAFTSTRNMLLPVGLVRGCHQLFVMDEDGKNVTQVGYLNLGSALHPTVLTDGRVMWSSYEPQGRRDLRLWGLWASYPDGRRWEPLFSAFTHFSVLHFHTQRRGGDLVVTEYYNSAMNGLGELYGWDDGGGFLSPRAADNPAVGRTTRRFPFQPEGLYAITPWAHGTDRASPEGRVGHPSEAPDGLLVTYSPGPASDKKLPTDRPYYDMGIYKVVGTTAHSASDLVKVADSPAYNENQPRAVVPYRAIYGIEAPREVPFLPHDSGHALLPPGTPFGLVGTSGVYARESHTTLSGRPKDANFRRLGGDAFPPGTGKYDSALIDRIRILVQEPTTRLGAGRDFRAVGDERLRILGEVPLRKLAEGGPVLDPAGDPDTSFLARIPADTSFTFQLIDKEGVALTTAQTWHQVRPGEVRYDCRGCHAHNRPGIEFAATEAAKPTYKVHDLTANKPTTVEYYRDVEPILKKSCLVCHGKKDAPKGAFFSAKTLLASRIGSEWAQGYAARLSPLYTRPRDGLMPPPDSGVPAPTKEEVLTIARWIDLGMPIEEPTSPYRNGVFADDQKPTLALESPRRDGAADRIRFGAFDFSGIKRVSVRASFWVKGRRPGSELFGLFGPPKDGVYSLDLGATVRSGVVTVTVTDGAGHEQTDERTFSEDRAGRAGR